jgi:hypothetical protein
MAYFFHHNVSRRSASIGNRSLEVRFRKEDRFSHEAGKAKNIIDQRRKNGIIKRPISRFGDAGDISELIAQRRCVVEAHRVHEHLIRNSLIDIPKGKFIETGKYVPSSGSELELTTERRLFPLTIGFLKNIAFADCVQEIFLRMEESPSSNFRRSDSEMVGWLSLVDAANLADLINCSIEGRIKLKIPSELLVSAFLHQRRLSDIKMSPIILTANHFYRAETESSFTYVNDLRQRAVDEKLIGDRRVLSDPTVIGEKKGAFVYRCPATGKEGVVERWGQPANSSMNNGVFFEVVDD